MEEIKQNISLRIAGKDYPFAIEPSREELMRRTVEEINSDVDDLRRRNPEKELVDILRIILLDRSEKMTALTLRNAGEYGTMLAQMQDLNDSLDDYLLGRR